MKKALAALVVLTMLLSAVAVAEADSLVGIWYLNTMESDGTSFNPADFGVEMSIELKDDGTAVVLSSEDETKEGTWSAEGDTVTVTVDDDPLVLTLTDGDLVAEEDDMKMVFGTEKSEAEAYVPGAPIEAAVEDFAGAWTATKIEMDGTYYDVALLGVEVTASIEDTTITLDGFMFSNNALPLEYADGVLTFSDTDEESGSFGSITAQLLDDGALSLTLDAGETGSFAFIMVRAEATEAAA